MDFQKIQDVYTFVKGSVSEETASELWEALLMIPGFGEWVTEMSKESE